MSRVQKSSLPQSFRRIRLELAREKAHPNGDASIGYVLVVPLTDAGLLDPDLVHAYKEACTIARFHRGEETDRGYLRRGPGGAWAFHYDFADGDEDDDPVYKLGQHRFALGEYVTIMEDEGAHTYRVSRIEELS